MPVRLTNTQRSIKIPAGSLRKAARLALSYLGYEGSELSILVTGDRKMRALNRAWRGIDRTTDVLSFSMLEEGAWGKGNRKSPQPPGACPERSRRVKGRRRGDLKTDASDAPPVSLGDIVISAPRAAAQAEELGQSLEAELIFLLMHGILHLAGYDHEGPSQERLKMERQQRKLTRLITAR